MNDVAINICAFTNDVATSGNNNAANQRVRADKPGPETREFEGPVKVGLDLLSRILSCRNYRFLTTLALPRYFASPFLPTISWARLQLETLSDLPSGELE